MAQANRQQVFITNRQQIAQRLRVGQSAILEKELSHEKSLCTILGWEPEHMVLLSLPSKVGQLGFLHTSNAVVIRFLFLGKAYGFVTKVMDLIRDHDLVLVSWPRRLEEVELTREMRFEVKMNISASLKSKSGPEFQPEESIKLLDISTGGCRLSVARNQDNLESYYSGREIEMRIPVAGQTDPAPVRVHIRNTAVTGEDLELGTQFRPGQEDVLERVRETLIPRAALEGLLTPEPSEAEPKPAPAEKPKAPPRPRPAKKPAPSTAAPPPAAQRLARHYESEALAELSHEVDLEEVTIDVVADLLGVKSIGGSMAAVVQCRRFVRDWVQNKGWEEARERRLFLLTHCKKIEGLQIQ